MELNANATALAQFYRLPTGTVTQSLNFDSDGSLMLLSSHGTQLRLNPVAGLAGSAVLGLGNAASQRLDATVSIGELMSSYGVGLGPALGITGFPDASGFYPTNLGGTQMLVGSKPAPILVCGQESDQLPISNSKIRQFNPDSHNRKDTLGHRYGTRSVAGNLSSPER